MVNNPKVFHLISHKEQKYNKEIFYMCQIIKYCKRIILNICKYLMRWELVYRIRSHVILLTPF